MSYENRQYVIFNVSELPLVNFAQVLESSPETVRRSLDNTKTFVKFTSPPTFLDQLTTKQGPYTHEEILAILATPEWTNPNIME